MNMNLPYLINLIYTSILENKTIMLSSILEFMTNS